MFNQVTLLGNLTRDIEIKYTGSGTAIASSGVATSHKFTSNGQKREEILFIDLTFFAKSAEIANSYLRKGSKLFVVGRLKLDTWEKDGQKRSKHTVIVESFKMLDSKADNQQPQQNQAPQVTHENIPAQPQQQAPQHPPLPEYGDDDEIPFAYIGLQYPTILHCC